jgi:hypothetical protein
MEKEPKWSFRHQFGHQDGVQTAAEIIIICFWQNVNKVQMQIAIPSRSCAPIMRGRLVRF